MQELTDQELQGFSRLMAEAAGISLPGSKKALVGSRLARRLQAMGCASYAQYLELLRRDAAERQRAVDLLTTNETYFFREPGHFAYLAERIVPAAESSRPLRVWSAACSSGEEPYSIAMTVLETLPHPGSWDVRILATDLDSEVLERARRGVYPLERTASLSAQRRERFFTEHRDGRTVSHRIAPEVASLVTFKQLNLMHPLPMKGPLDVVFCRNVIIYFDKDTQRDLFTRICRLQRPGDLLLLGHSESLFKVCESYGLIGKTIYRRL